jgi:hypothetical protein
VKLQMIPVPAWSPPSPGPWRIKYTWPDGADGLGVSLFEDRDEADYWCTQTERICRQGCTYEVVSDRTGGSK